MNRWLTMPQRVEAYLSARRALGYELRVEGKQLRRFARFAEQQGHRGELTLELALDWANASEKKSAIGPARRLEPLRPFAKYCALFEPATEIPPPRLLGPAHRRIAPRIYSDEEITAMLAAAQQLSPTEGLRPATMRCLLGLLAATGLRVSEALRLHRSDVDLDRGLLTVRETKFHKSRYVPLHPTAREALAEYAGVRDRAVPRAQDLAFFLFDNGRAVNYEQARYAFGQIRSRLGWDRPSNGRLPRLYDLRHAFACKRLLAWYAEGVDVHWAIPLLATYLGHNRVSNTYWYLTAIPALLAVAADRRREQLPPQPLEDGS
jgi:integrase